MKTIITGGAGFIGSNASSRYLKRGHQVVVVDSLARDGVGVVKKHLPSGDRHDRSRSGGDEIQLGRLWSEHAGGRGGELSVTAGEFLVGHAKNFVARFEIRNTRADLFHDARQIGTQNHRHRWGGCDLSFANQGIPGSDAGRADADQNLSLGWRGLRDISDNNCAGWTKLPYQGGSHENLLFLF